jgi:hypothetical protein
LKRKAAKKQRRQGRATGTKTSSAKKAVPRRKATRRKRRPALIFVELPLDPPPQDLTVDSDLSGFDDREEGALGVVGSDAGVGLAGEDDRTPK